METQQSRWQQPTPPGTRSGLLSWSDRFKLTAPLHPIVSAARKLTTALGMVALVGLMALSFLAGCATTGRMIPMPDLGDQNPAQLAATMETHSHGATSVRGFARMEAYGPKGRVKVDQLILAQAPSMLRIETLTPFDQPLSWLTSDGTTFNLYTLEEKKFYTGPATETNIARLLPVRLPPQALINLILGGVPTITASPEGEPQWDHKQGEWILHYRNPEHSLYQKVRIDPGTLQVRETQVLRETVINNAERSGPSETRQTVLYTLKYEDRKKAGGFSHFPHKVRILMPGEKLDITFQWRDIELDQELPDTAWTLEQPRGVPVITLTE